MLTISILYLSMLTLAVSARPFSSFPSQPDLPTAGSGPRPSPDVQDDPRNTYRNDSYSDIPIFNPLYPQKEIRNVAAKYSKARAYLAGKDLSILPNFTKLASELQGKDPTEQVAGSTYSWDLQTYGADLSYYGGLTLGTSPQHFLFDVDTGSADLWVPSNCAACNPGKAQFNSAASTTYHETDQPFKVTYGSGNCEGVVAQESITLGPFATDKHYFGAVSKQSDDFTDVTFDGIIGMAFSSISATRESTFMESIIQDRQVNSAVFGVHLTRRQPRQSEVCIGCYDPSKYIGDVMWNPVISKTYWNIALANIKVNGVDTAPREVTAAIDTGTSLIYIPQDLADAMYGQLQGSRHAPQYGAGIYTYPCASQPIISLVFGGETYQIDLRDFNLGRTSSSESNCVGGILAMGSDFPANLAIVGAEFLKSWYSVYDYDHGTSVGFAKSINNN